VLLIIVFTRKLHGHTAVEETNIMKELKKDLAHLWKHKEAVIGIVIILISLISALILLEILIDKTF
jgi:hypothetical protein